MNFSFLSGQKVKINLLDPTDVESNRRGQITPAQDKRLNGMAMGAQGCSALFMPLIIMAVFFFILISSLAGGGSLRWFMFIPLLLIIIFSLGSARSLYSWWQNSARLKSDRANNIIHSLTGELAFDRKKEYIFQTLGDQPLVIPPSNNVGGLLPGVKYNVYYLPESGFILSAEQLGEASQAQIRLALSNILAQANNFTAEDLQANQQGEITASQRKRGSKKIINGLVILAFSLAFALIFIVPFITGNNTNESLIFILIVGGFIIVFGAIGFWMVLNAILDMTATTPDVVEGRGHKEARRKSSGKSSRTVYYYIIGPSEFEVPQKAFAALIEDVDYRVYFTPRTKTLISIEPTGIPQI
jgi:protein-S-isoprenylcysteine O-methyltransferase Ste14